jgi:CxxC motif-containing protein
VKQILCIVCPNGCLIQAGKQDGAWLFSGNKCARGADFALSEMTCPMRTLTSTVRTSFNKTLPVRTVAPIPKAKMMDVMKLLADVVITQPLAIGDTVIQNALGLGVDIIASSNILAEEDENG